MGNKENTVVVVLSRNYSTGLSVIRSLGEVGYTVDLIASSYKEGNANGVRTSKYIRNSVEVVTKKVKDGGDPALIEELLKYEKAEEEKHVLLPTDDYTTSIMDMNREVLSSIFIMPEIIGQGQGSLKHHMDKSVQGEIARRVGINVPPEWVISLREEEIVIPDEMIYPCYCKPLESSLGLKLEMARCNNQEELLAHLHKLRERFSERSILVQKFLDIDEEIDLEGVCINQEIILPAIIWKRIVAQHDKGVPLTGCTYPTEKLGEMRDKVISMLKEFCYFGMFDLGLHLVGEDFYFNEINMRSGGTNFVYFKSGVNLPEIFVKEAIGIGHDPEEERIDEFGKTYFYEKVAWADYFNGYMSREELDKNNAEAEITFMCNDEDPIPGELFMEEVFEKERAREEKRQRAELAKKRREECIAATIESTGWSHEYADEKINEAREKLGVKYKDYTKFELWKYEGEEQEEEYNRCIERRERIKKQKEECIMSAMKKTGWDRAYAEQQIKDARERLGITYVQYMKYDFCLIPEKKQSKKYAKILKNKS